MWKETNQTFHVVSLQLLIVINSNVPQMGLSHNLFIF